MVMNLRKIKIKLNGVKTKLIKQKPNQTKPKKNKKNKSNKPNETEKDKKDRSGRLVKHFRST